MNKQDHDKLLKQGLTQKEIDSLTQKGFTKKEQFITAPFFFYASAYSNTYFDPPNP